MKKLILLLCILISKYTINNRTISKQGTGFYYIKEIDSLNETAWLISNRHVFLPDETIPDTLFFHLRKKVDNRYFWHQVKIPKDSIIKNIKYFTDKRIDVAALNVTAIFNKVFKENKELSFAFALTEKDMSASAKFIPEVGDEILAIGYPKGFYQ